MSERPHVDLDNFVMEVVEPPSLDGLINRLNEANAVYIQIRKGLEDLRAAETQCMRKLTGIKADIDKWYKDNIRT